MHPSLPRLLRMILALAVSATLLASPAITSAAPKGSGLTVTVTELTPAVSPSHDGAFQVVVVNAGNASLTHALLTVTITGGTVAGLPDECGGTASVTCDLGTLVANDSRTLTFVIGAPNAAGTITLSASLQVDAGSGNPSQDQAGDAGVITVSDDQSFFGAWQGSGQALIGSIASIHGAAHQTASASVPAVDFPYAAEMSESTARICGERGIGQAVDLQFADGEPVSPYLTVTVTYDDAARGNRTPGNVGFVHLGDDGSCSFLVKGCATAGCFTAEWLGSGPGKLLKIVAYLPSNGIVKGF